ncbi:MAG TPA: DUF1990 family protein, partial [Armatimonadota bacterium]|nr:DUF1990 family protein [Armatimonadota bacterium]
MARWRFGRGWREEELRRLLAELPGCRPNFSARVEEMTRERGWHYDPFERELGREAAGAPLPGGLFCRAREGLIRYEFSDPRLVEAHFDAAAPLKGRNMLIDMKAGGFHFLNPVRVRDAWDESRPDQSCFGFEYETLEGHIERGIERFMVIKEHRTGCVRFRIEDHWRPGDFPTWWSRAGFLL